MTAADAGPRFDRRADVPPPVSMDEVRRSLTGAIEAVIGPDAAYASLATGGLMLTEANAGLIAERDRRRWFDSRTAYGELRGMLAAGGTVDAVVGAITCAADDLRHGAADAAGYLYDTIARPWWDTVADATLVAVVADLHQAYVDGAAQGQWHVVAELAAVYLDAAPTGIRSAAKVAVADTAGAADGLTQDRQVAWWVTAATVASLQAVGDALAA